MADPDTSPAAPAAPAQPAGPAPLTGVTLGVTLLALAASGGGSCE